MAYWICSLLLVAFWFVSGFSIAQPFLFVGLALRVLGPLRRWPRLYWPPLIGVVAFWVGYLLVVPLQCTSSSMLDGSSHTACSSILGPTWSGSGLYNPPPEAFDLAFRVGLGAAVAAAIITLAWLTLRRRREPPSA